MAAHALAVRAVLDGDGSADRPVRPGDLLAGGAQGAAAGGQRARTDHRAGALPRQQPSVASAGGQDHARPEGPARCPADGEGIAPSVR